MNAPAQAFEQALHLAQRATYLTARWSRFRWMLTSGFIISLLMALGGEYLIGGPHVVATTNAYAMFHFVMPEGIRGHGAVMLGLGSVLLVTLIRQQGGLPVWWPTMRVTLWLCSGYFLWTATLFALAPTQPGGTLSWPGVTIWTLMAIVPLVLTFGPPPGIVTGSEVDLVQAAMDAGLSGVAAASLARQFFGRPDEGY